MLSIYLDLSIACLTLGLTYLHKTLIERPLPIREMVPEEDTTGDKNIKMIA